MIAIALTIVAATAAGFGVEGRLGELRAQVAASAIARLMLWGLLPPVVFVNVAGLEFTGGIVAGLAFAYVAVAAAVGGAYAIGRWLSLPRPATGALMLVAGLGNTGYLGVPFTAALFGLDDVPDALVYDVVVSGGSLLTVGFAIGAAFGTVAESPRQRVSAFFKRNPALWAFALALVAPSALAPDWAVSASHYIVFGMLPLGFFVVGVALASEAEDGVVRFPPRLTAPVGAAIGLKLILAPAIVFSLSQIFIAVPDPYISQAAMACGINSILIAHAYGLDRSLAATAIAWSTAIVVVAGLGIALL